MEKAQFQDKVFAILKRNVSGFSIEKSDNVEFINLVDTTDASVMQLGLYNLHREYQQQPYSDDDLQGVLNQRVSDILNHQVKHDKPMTLTWPEIEEKVFPQLHRNAHIDFPDLFYQQFNDELIVTCVIDHEEYYQFITNEHIRQWGISEDELIAEALYNLHKLSEGMELEVTQGSDKYMLITKLDGFDASRILLPGITELAIEHLGEPFFAAIPNRDFLMMWSAGSSDDFVKSMIEQVIEGFSTQPYPLSYSIFLVSEDEIQTISVGSQ